MEPHGRDGRACFVVYAEVSHALAARKIFKNHRMEGRFIRMKTHFIPLAKYSMLISNALCGEYIMLVESIKAHTNPCYNRLARGAQNAHGL